MAEIGLAASITRPQDRWRVQIVSGRALGDGQWIHTAREAADAVRIVSAGPALDDYEVAAAGRALGALSIRGPSIGTDASTGRPLGVDHAYETGDIGFVDVGWVYPCGRGDDHIVTHGRNLHAPSVESKIGAVPGVRDGRVAVIDLPSGDWLVLFECERKAQRADELEQLVRKTAATVTGAQPSVVVMVGRGRIPLTDSGKLRRSETKRRYALGEFGT